MAKVLRDIVPKTRKFVPDIPHQPQYPDRDKAQRKFEKLHAADEHDDRQGNGDDVRKGSKQKGPNYPTPGQVDSKPEKLKRDGSQLESVQIDEARGKKFEYSKMSKRELRIHLDHHRTQARETSDAIDREVGRGAKIGMSDPLSVKFSNHMRHIRGIKKHLGEEVEQIDELSKKTLGSYIKKASRDAGEAEARASAAYTRDRKLNNKVVSRLDDKADRRYAGIDAATKRLTKED